jgi:hypothetical protein
MMFAKAIMLFQGALGSAAPYPPTDAPLVDTLVRLKGNDPAGGAQILEQMERWNRGHQIV